ncbi:MAG: hypothetical protein ACDS79_13960 [Enterobacteriaceae bacterium]
MSDQFLKQVRETNDMLAEMNNREVKRQWKRHQLREVREVREEKIEELPPFLRALARAWIDVGDAPLMPALLIFGSGVAVGVAITLSAVAN